MKATFLQAIKKGAQGILAFGVHPAIFQSILDFDYISGKTTPSIQAIITRNRKTLKLFFGNSEVLIPCYSAIQHIPTDVAEKISWMLSLESGRRSFESVVSFFTAFPDSLGAHIFAENVPEKHATELIRMFGSRYLILGPSGVGLLVPGALKLGAIGGVGLAQIAGSGITERGKIAVCSTSGGMTNELIHAVTHAKHRVSFAACVGGDRFPVTSLTDIFLIAEGDPETKAMVYFGELGGVDEYEIIRLIQSKKFTKPIIAYIAGVVDDMFDDHVQFGHAKALVRTDDESARAKRTALVNVGVTAPETFTAFLQEIKKMPGASSDVKMPDITSLMDRQKTILTTRRVVSEKGVLSPVVKGKLSKNAGSLFVPGVLEALLGRPVKSDVTVAFADTAFRLLIDHGGHVSGAVNTMITARAGRDMATSLASGILTIGSRFGGAVNAAAKEWHESVQQNANPAEYVRASNARGQLIPGIGHKKYRVGLSDPRVTALLTFASLLKKPVHTRFAQAVEKITTGKNGKLILNVDGAIAAILLDILSEKEEMSENELQTLIESEFFNSFFIIPRTVGFIAHFLEQKKNDEGLFRLPDELLFERADSKVALKKVGKRKKR